MTVWIVRAGRHGEGEDHALQHQVVGIGWPELGDLTRVGSAGNLRLALDAVYPDARPSTLARWGDQLEAFRFRMRAGDLVALPLRSAPAVAIGRLTGDYRYAPDAVVVLRHQRSVEWRAEAIPRDRIDQELLDALGTVATVGQLSGPDAEQRVEALLAGPPVTGPVRPTVNVGEIARDQIRRRIAARFPGHELAHLVGALLRADGFTCDSSPPGPDGSVAILAGPGRMGFDGPTLAVRVMPGSTAVDASALRELKGAMSNLGAQRGLLVSWSGFTPDARQEARGLFFEVRLWDSGTVIVQLEQLYDHLPADVKAELPLQRVWALPPGD